MGLGAGDGQTLSIDVLVDAVLFESQLKGRVGFEGFVNELKVGRRQACVCMCVCELLSPPRSAGPQVHPWRSPNMPRCRPLNTPTSPDRSES